MDEKKRGSGFDAPVIGEIAPEGSVIRKNPDGTISILPPQKASCKKGKKKGKEGKAERKGEREIQILPGPASILRLSAGKNRPCQGTFVL